MRQSKSKFLLPDFKQKTLTAEAIMSSAVSADKQTDRQTETKKQTIETFRYRDKQTDTDGDGPPSPGAAIAKGRNG